MNTHSVATHSELKHMGMQVEGVRARGVQGRILVTRNVATGRRWIVDPATGIGEPAPDEPEIQLAEPVTESRAKPARRSSGGPFPCDQCGQKHLFVLRFPDGTVMSKCLSCRRFVVDGQVERDSKRAALRQARNWTKRRKKRAAESSQPQGELLELAGSRPAVAAAEEAPLDLV